MGGISKQEELPKIPPPEEPVRKARKVLKYRSKGPDVLEMKRLINKFGYALNEKNELFLKRTESTVKDFQSKNGLTVDGIVGPKTWAVLEAGPKKEVPQAAIPHEINPAYVEAKKYDGKGENDSKFVAWLSGFWKIVGLPNYKTIIGTTFAWCGLFVAAMNSEVGQEWISNGAGAKNWAKYGVEIDWKKDGIPKSAVIHLDHDCDCKGDSNHVGFADGDCSAEDLAKPGATINIFGGNQSNQVNARTFKTCEICAVRWPKEIPKPGKILKSLNCTGKTEKAESTR